MRAREVALLVGFRVRAVDRQHRKHHNPTSIGARMKFSLRLTALCILIGFYNQAHALIGTIKPQASCCAATFGGSVCCPNGCTAGWFSASCT